MASSLSEFQSPSLALPLLGWRPPCTMQEKEKADMLSTARLGRHRRRTGPAPV